MSLLKSFLSKSALLVSLLSVSSVSQALVIYTDRPTDRVQPAAVEFEARTGQKVTIVELSYDKLLARLKAEAQNPVADLIFVKDLVLLAELSKDGYFQALQTPAVTSLVEPAMQDSQKMWTAITYRARTLVYDPAQVKANEIQNYVDLADAKWAGRLCLRTGKGGYNEALVASLIENLGYAKAKEVVANYVANLAVAVKPNDNQVIEAIAQGDCAVGIVNSYYLAGYYAKNSNFPVKISFLNQSTTGTHVNGAGVGVTATSKNAALAESFIGLLLEEKFQLQFSAGHLDYPARKGLTPNTLVKEWGTFKADAANWSKLGTLVPEARRLMSEVGYQ